MHFMANERREKIVVDVKKGIDNWMKVHKGEI
jgi:hypothetical protein